MKLICKCLLLILLSGVASPLQLVVMVILETLIMSINEHIGVHILKAVDAGEFSDGIGSGEQFPFKQRRMGAKVLGVATLSLCPMNLVK